MEGRGGEGRALRGEGTACAETRTAHVQDGLDLSAVLLETCLTLKPGFTATFSPVPQHEPAQDGGRTGLFRVHVHSFRRRPCFPLCLSWHSSRATRRNSYFRPICSCLCPRGPGVHGLRQPRAPLRGLTRGRCSIWVCQIGLRFQHPRHSVLQINQMHSRKCQRADHAVTVPQTSGKPVYRRSSRPFQSLRKSLHLSERNPQGDSGFGTASERELGQARILGGAAPLWLALLSEPAPSEVGCEPWTEKAPLSTLPDLRRVSGRETRPQQNHRQHSGATLHSMQK